jgi:hypothetical protein
MGFSFTLQRKSLQEAIVNKQMLYIPGVYMIYDYSGGKTGSLLYFGKAGADLNGNLNKHQLPKRLLATCELPCCYPDFNGKVKDITRDYACTLMMKCDGIDCIIIHYFYTTVKFKNGSLRADPAPGVVEKEIATALKNKGLLNCKWSTKKYKL